MISAAAIDRPATRGLDWYEGVLALRGIRVPADYGGHHLPAWREMIEDADDFVRKWEDRALALGWTTLDIFGADCLKPFARIDHAGLVPILRGRKLVDLTPDFAKIWLGRDHFNRFYRRPTSAEQVPVWELR